MTTIAFSTARVGTAHVGTARVGTARSGAAPFSAAQQPRLRLTSRGRLVFGTLAAIPVIAVALLVGPNVLGANATADLGTGDFTYVSIAPGESLWQLAAEVAPQADPRDVVADILKLNNLSSGDVQPGQELALPPQYAH